MRWVIASTMLSLSDIKGSLNLFPSNIGEMGKWVVFMFASVLIFVFFLS